MKRLDLVVGPNGAGKSTFIELVLTPLLAQSSFVNADAIARQRWPNSAEEHSYEAARIAARTRDGLIDRGASFIAETEFSHPSKLTMIDAAHHKGYVVALHVVMIPEELAVQRVRVRVNAGGHAVPEMKIRRRYHRLWTNVSTAITLCDTATLYDNSSRNAKIVARFSDGGLVGAAQWPLWTPESLRARFDDSV